MEIIKKNILSVIAGVVAVLALVAWVWPLGRITTDAQNRLSDRARVYTSMQQLLTADRSMPVVSLQSSAGPQKLGMFPTDKVIAWGDDLTRKLATEASGVKEVALQLNRQPLLVADTLPVPLPTTEFKFRDYYTRYVMEFAKAVKAGTPPTAADIAQAQNELWKTKFEPQITVRNGQPDPASQKQVEAEFQKEVVDVPDQVKTERARSILFYMDPQALDVNSQIIATTGAAGAGTPPTAVMIWDAQLKIWVQNDVARAIIGINSRMSAMHCVIDAPVKQLLQVRVGTMRGQGAVAAAGAAGMSAMGPMGPMGGPPPNMGLPPGMGMPGMAGPMGGGAGATPAAESITGRTANPLYDVVPFTITAHVEASKLPDFLEELGTNRFITPCQVTSIRAIDSLVVSAQTNVMYGSAPVVEVVISCEDILLREWTAPLMPPEIRASLQLDNAAGSATPAK